MAFYTPLGTLAQTVLRQKTRLLLITFTGFSHSAGLIPDFRRGKLFECGGELCIILLSLYITDYNEAKLTIVRNYAQDILLTEMFHASFIKSTDLSEFNIWGMTQMNK